MKKFLNVISAFVLGMSLTMMVSCSEDSKESCSKEDEDLGICAADDITTCCDDQGSCYYEYQGERIDYQKLLDQCKSNTSAKEVELMQIQLDETTARLIEEARTAALCN